MTPSKSNQNQTEPQIPDFDLLRPIGEGGFGQVWLAVNRTTGQPRAIKVIARARLGDRDPAGREVAALMRLEANSRCRHPNLLAIHHVGETAEHLFYVMDLADDIHGAAPSGTAADQKTPGPDYLPATLENLLASGPLDKSKCARYARQLLAGLACLHKAGMVHRDVKPANCLLLGDELKLGDFGLLTAASLVASRVGTLRYMPPDGCMDARADVYAAGLVIYEMLTGLPAERFPSLGSRTHEIASDRLLARLNRLTLRACDQDKDRRFQNAHQMLAALDGVEGLPRKRLRVRWIAAVASIVLASTALLWLLRPVTVDANFVTEPYEATIYLDGHLLRMPDKTPYRTPCTVHGLPPRTHRVVFEWEADRNPFTASTMEGKLDIGNVNFAENREIIARLKDR